MWAVIPLKKYLMTSLGMTISSCPWKVEPFLVCSGVGGNLFTTPSLLDHIGWTRRHTALHYLHLAKVVNRRVHLLDYRQ